MRFCRSKLLGTAVLAMGIASAGLLSGCRHDGQTEGTPAGRLEVRGSVKPALPGVRPDPNAGFCGVPLDESAADFAARLDASEQGLKSWMELKVPLERSLRYVKAHNAERKAVDRPGLSVTWGEMQATIERLLELLPRLDREPGLFRSEFEWIPVLGGILYSAYHEPRISASKKRDAAHPMPLYANPGDVSRVKRERGSYWTRAEIDGGGALAGRGLELAWVDPVDAFFLQVQGSGLLVFPDGSVRSVLYDGQNGHKYRSSKRILMERGVELPRYDIVSQREWFTANPDKVQGVLFENPSYVFFKFGQRRSVGAINAPMDPWVSLASDPSFIPLGSVMACGVEAPYPNGRAPLRFIGLAQDTGGAIKRNRIDIFAGGGAIADYAAAKLDSAGPAWILVKKAKPAG